MKRPASVRLETSLDQWLGRFDGARTGFQRRHSDTLRRLGVAALVILLLAGGLLTLANLRTWATWGQQRPLTLDFALYRACAIQGIQYGWGRLYDVALQHQVYSAEEAADPGAGTMAFAPNVCTPAEGWIAAPFTAIPLRVGYLIWSILTFATTAFGFVTLAPGRLLAKITQTALAFVPYLVLLSVSEGQVTSFQIAGLAAAWLLMLRGRDVWGGVLLGLMILKPQTLLLVPFTLLAAGRYRAFSGWLIAMAVLGLLGVANLGLDGTIAYVHRLQFASTGPPEYLGGLWYNLPAHFSTRFGRTAVEIVAAAFPPWLAWRYRRGGPEVALAAGLVGSLLIAPYLHLDDLIMLFPATWLILRAEPRPLLWVLAGAGYLVALACMDPQTHVVLSNRYLTVDRWGEGLLLYEVILLVAVAVVSHAPDAMHPGRRLAAA